MSDIAVHVEGVGKEYHIAKVNKRYVTLRDTLISALTGPFRRAARLMRGHAGGAAELGEVIWALKDISFEIKHGEVLGIIGHNGSGKTTLLKILSRITEPTEGYGEIRGRVGCLLEVGTGFHPELTGRENIYLNGAILGMKRTEIDRKFDEILAFSEVARFIDTPVKHYSSGMSMRLAFAVAAHLEPEILIVDEVLAVGDATFQKKCIGKMGEVAKQGRTVLFVSHNMGAVVQLCERALWLERGRLKLDGVPSDVVTAYLSSSSAGSATWISSLSNSRETGTQINSVRVLSASNEPSTIIEFDKGFKVEVGYEINEPMANLAISCQVYDTQGHTVWTTWDTDTGDWTGRTRAPGQYLSVCTIPGALLRPGRYYLSVGALVVISGKRRRRTRVIEHHENMLSFDVSDVGCPFDQNRGGILTPSLAWEVKRLDEQDPLPTGDFEHMGVRRVVRT